VNYHDFISSDVNAGEEEVKRYEDAIQLSTPDHSVIFGEACVELDKLSYYSSITNADTYVRTGFILYKF